MATLGEESSDGRLAGAARTDEGDDAAVDLHGACMEDEAAEHGAEDRRHLAQLPRPLAGIDGERPGARHSRAPGSIAPVRSKGPVTTRRSGCAFENLIVVVDETDTECRVGEPVGREIRQLVVDEEGDTADRVSVGHENTIPVGSSSNTEKRSATSGSSLTTTPSSSTHA